MKDTWGRHLFFLGFVCISVIVCADSPNDPNPTAPPLHLTASSPSDSGTHRTPTNLPDVVVVSKRLDNARDQIVPSLGATKYTVNTTNIALQSQGDNATLRVHSPPNTAAVPRGLLTSRPRAVPTSPAAASRSMAAASTHSTPA